MYLLLFNVICSIVLQLSSVAIAANLPTTSQINVVNTIFDNRGKISYDTQITAEGKISGGILCGSINNSGEISNLAICDQGQVNGGRVAGTVVNQGTLCDIKIAQDAQVTGGSLCGLVINQGTIANVTLKDNTVIKGGTLQGSIQGDVNSPAYLGALHVADGSQLCGVKLSPTVQLGTNVTLCDNVIVPADLSHPSLRDFNIDPENLEKIDLQQLPRLEEGAFQLLLSDHMSRLSPELFTEFNAAHINALSWKGVRGITIAQFQQLPYDKLAAFTKDNLGALSPEIVKQLHLVQLEQLKPVIKTLEERDVIMFLTCLSTDIPMTEIVDLVPKNWHLDMITGALLPPPNAKLFFRKMDNLSTVPKQVDLEYDLPDINTGLGVAGRASEATLLQGIQLALALSGLSDYSITQQSDGILVVTHGSSKLTLIPDLENLQQADDYVAIGISVANNGNYQVVTPDRTRITLLAIPKRFDDLATLFGENSRSKCNKSGDVLLQVSTQYLRHGHLRQVRDDEVNVVSTFDPFVEPASEDICQDGVCNWDAADESLQPGLTLSEDDNTRAQQISKITYTDGTSQRIYPSVLQPNIFIEEALKISGVEAITFNRDGIFTVNYQGAQYHLYPSFHVQTTTVSDGQIFAAQLTINADNTVSYSVQDEAKIFTFKLTIGS